MTAAKWHVGIDPRLCPHELFFRKGDEPRMAVRVDGGAHWNWNDIEGSTRLFPTLLFALFGFVLGVAVVSLIAISNAGGGVVNGFLSHAWGALFAGVVLALCTAIFISGENRRLSREGQRQKYRCMEEIGLSELRPSNVATPNFVRPWTTHVLVPDGIDDSTEYALKCGTG